MSETGKINILSQLFLNEELSKDNSEALQRDFRRRKRQSYKSSLSGRSGPNIFPRLFRFAEALEFLRISGTQCWRTRQ